MESRVEKRGAPERQEARRDETLLSVTDVALEGEEVAGSVI